MAGWFFQCRSCASAAWGASFVLPWVWAPPPLLAWRSQPPHAGGDACSLRSDLPPRTKRLLRVDQEYDPQRDPQLALICSRLYRKLGVAPGRWPGLLQLPSICENHPQEAFVLIKRYRSFFDPPAAPAQPGAWSLADLIVDPEQQHAQQHLLGQPTHKSVVMVYELMGSCLASKEDDVIMREAMAATAATAQPSDAGASGGGSGTAPHAAPYPGSPPAAGSASSSDGANKQETGGSSGGGGGMTHLYDSRARMALRRVCAWLRVPQTKLLAFEQMWAGELLRLQHTSEGPSLKVGNRFTNAFKVGAAAVGGGALLALTGGIAAPAVAAALVPLFTSIGGASSYRRPATTDPAGFDQPTCSLVAAL